MSHKYTPVGTEIADPGIERFRSVYYDPGRTGPCASMVMRVASQLDAMIELTGDMKQQCLETGNPHTAMRRYLDDNAYSPSMPLTARLHLQYVAQPAEAPHDPEEAYRLTLTYGNQHVSNAYANEYLLQFGGGNEPDVHARLVCDSARAMFSLDGKRRTRARGFLRATRYDIVGLSDEVGRLAKAPTQEYGA